MCGIAGFIAAKSPGRHSSGILSKMLGPLRMRGPDNEGQWTGHDERWDVALGHRRLAILDLSAAANQPMCRDQLTIVYNGEIYNFIELRRELETLGRSFTTHSDTEVLLAAYRQWGEECLERLNGMFAFALWDATERKLFCARDRAGERPFYYYVDQNRFVLASEIKSVMAFGAPVPRAPDQQRLVEYLTKGYQPMGEATHFEGVRELLPAHKLTLRVTDALQYEVAPYWKFPVNGVEAPPISVEEFRSLFEDAVRLRLRSDVPIGTCLSGGVDSPSVAATVIDLARRERATQVSYRGVHAYSPFREADERYYVRRFAEDLSLDVSLVEITGAGCLSELDDLIYHQEIPFLDPSIYAQRCVFRRAAELGLKVMFDGQGSDELFGGYDWVVPRVIAAIGKQRGWLPAARQLRAFAGPRFPLLRLLAQTIARRRPRKGREFPDDLNAALRASFSTLGLPTLLRQGDRNSMTFGVEVRLPFLDYRLVEATVRLRPEDIADNGLTKALVRRAMRDRVPAEILDRKDKFGFAVPQARWIRNEMREAVREAVHDSLWKELDFPGKSKLLKSALAETDGQPYNRMAWKVLCAVRWRYRFFEN